MKHAVLAATVILALCASGADAAEQPQADPAAYLRAFTDTCLHGFPDFDRIGRDAAATGWQGSQLRVIGNAHDLPESMPQAFRKDGLMLFLTTPTSGKFRQVCQITGSATTRLTGADIAALVSPQLGGTPVPDKARDHDSVQWTMAPGTTVQAGISIYGRTRTISLSVRRED